MWLIMDYTPAASAKGVPCAEPNGLEKDYIYTGREVTFTPVETYPDWQDGRVEALNLSDHQGDQYLELCSTVFDDGPAHHLLAILRLSKEMIWIWNASPSLTDCTVVMRLDIRLLERRNLKQAGKTGFYFFNWIPMMMQE
jgi:hypothetical protein